MNREALCLIVGTLAVAGVVMGCQLYSERRRTDRVEIAVGKNGTSVEKK